MYMSFAQILSEGHPGQCCIHLSAFTSYRRLSPQFQFSLSGVTLVYLSHWYLHSFRKQCRVGGVEGLSPTPRALLVAISGPKKSRFSGPTPSNGPDFPASKSLHPAPYKQQVH
jgi:hypothetical protein